MFKQVLIVILTLFLLLSIPLNNSLTEASITFSLPNETEESPLNTEKLPTIDSISNLQKLLSTFSKNNNNLFTDVFPFTFGGMRKTTDEVTMDGSSMDAASISSSNISSDFAEANYSTTNLQVQGVDEADIVKTDGEYIYRINSTGIILLDVSNPKNMQIINTIKFEENDFFPQEIFLDDQYLVALGQFNRFIKMQNNDIQERVMADVAYSPYYSQQTGIKIFDIQDKNKLKEVRELVLDGSYVSSRKIDKSLYLVTNKSINFYNINKQQEPTEYLPAYYDSQSSKEIQVIDLKDICYFPDAVYPNYMTILGINLEDPHGKADISSYLGYGENIYASKNNLYVAANNYRPHTLNRQRIFDYSTTIYSFQLKKGNVDFLNSGEVPGTVLNQFSMDEYEGHFRIATTTGEMWRNDEYTSKNHVFILDNNLDIVGKLENIAPTEKIYSMRFMGDKGYMVTFRQTDPFFVIDLKDPSKPKVLGYLKIPGYSDYLHPYDDNHIIGFGKEVNEDKHGNAFEAGMKIALFDVKDVENPKEKFKVKIGGRGTNSPLLQDHKALLFSKEKNILAFPVEVYENKSQDYISNWGDFVFQGAYIYQLNLQQGFTLKNKITHMEKEDFHKSGSYWYNADTNIDRIVYIKNHLFTLSNNKVKVYDANTHEFINELALEW